MSLILYQFPISHFCEKVRWALDYKGLTYQTKNLLPGLHVKTTKAMGPGSSVPVLQHDGKSIQGSAQIISYLDEQFPDKKLTPINAQEKQAATEWERFLDQELGVHVRRFVYQTILQRRGLTIGFLANNGPIWAKPFLWLVFPRLKARMRKYMDINAKTAEVSKQHIHKALKRINETLVDKKFLVGDRFSRADLTACALLAPLFMPPQYGLKWPQKLPDPLQSDIQAMTPQMQWAVEIYKKYR